MTEIPANHHPEVIETGRCALCGQEMCRASRGGVVEDVWHPAGVERACPEQPANPKMTEPGSVKAWNDWYNAGNRPGRPGFEHFIPDPEETG